MKNQHSLCLCCFVLLGVVGRGLSSNDKEHDVIGNRNKRGVGVLATYGRKALDTLLKGAVQIPSKSTDMMEYQKIGSVKSALRDFYSTNPTYVQKFRLRNGSYARSGEVGDRTIVLKSNSQRGTPTIEFIQNSITSKENPIIRITYMKELDY